MEYKTESINRTYNELRLNNEHLYMEYVIITVFIILFGIFLYWAYLPDYKRNPKEFWRTIIGMPIGMLLGGIGFRDLNEKIRKWAVGEKEKSKTEK